MFTSFHRAALAAFLAFFLCVGRATGDVITVTTTDDTVNASDGVTSLREAIAEANASGSIEVEIDFDPARRRLPR